MAAGASLANAFLPGLFEAIAAANTKAAAAGAQPSTSASTSAGPNPNPNGNPQEFLSKLASTFLPGLFEAQQEQGKAEGNGANPNPAPSVDEFLSTAAAFASTYFPDLFDAVTGVTTKKEKVVNPESQAEAKAKDNAFEVKLNVSEFSPSELSVKTVGNTIVVEGKADEKADELGSVSRSFLRRFVIPESVKPESVDCKLSSDGFLVLSAPLVDQSPVTTERSVPINVSHQPPIAIASTSATAYPEQAKVKDGGS
jgi:HSP20 family molecular chaperone IbpA